MPLYIFFRHHKAAGGWISNICREASHAMGMRFEYMGTARNLGHRNDSPANIANYLERYKIDFVSYGNVSQTLIDQLPEFKGFNVIRDPRDMLVSAYFSHLKSHPTTGWPELAERRETLKEMSKDDGIMEVLGFMEPIYTRMFEWNYSNPNILELRYEDLTINSEEQFVRIFDWLGLLDHSSAPEQLDIRALVARATRKTFFNRYTKHIPHTCHFPLNKIHKDTLLNIVNANNFSKISGGRKHGTEEATSHYRKGVTGDWANHLNNDNIHTFKQRYGNLLIKLGYEHDNSWGA